MQIAVVFFLAEQGCVPQILLEKLIEYKQVHQLTSITQAISAVLMKFFNIESTQLDLSLDDADLFQRIDQSDTPSEAGGLMSVTASKAGVLAGGDRLNR